MSVKNQWCQCSVFLTVVIISFKIWMLVFETMIRKRSHNEIECCINSSLYFRNFLGSSRPTLLFPGVFKVLAPKYKEEADSAFKEPKRRFKQKIHPSMPPCVIDRLRLLQAPRKQKRITKLRLVCKIWKFGVDNYYQKLPHHFAMNHDFDVYRKYHLKSFSNLCTSPPDWSQEYFSSDEHEKTKKFLNRFQQTNLSQCSPGTPFISRRVFIRDRTTCVSLSNQMVDPRNITYNVVHDILDRFGSNIWYVDIMICDHFPTMVDYYRTVRQWLLLMPNLKVVNITYVGENPSTSDINQLQSDINENHLPVLKNLKYLQTDKLPSPILNELLRQSSNSVSMLQVHKNEGQVEDNIISASTPAINLKQLSVRLDCDEEFSMLRDLGKTWKLEKLYLDYNLNIQVRDLNTVFGIPANWSNTLTNLMISLPDTGNMGKVKKQADDLSGLILFTPNVKRFKLILEKQTAIDFMLPMRDNLESFEVGFIGKVATEQVEMDELAKSCSKQVIQFVGYEGRLVQSNIWQLFPKLQNIQVWSDYNKNKPIFNKSLEVNRKAWSQSGIKYYPRLK